MRAMQNKAGFAGWHARTVWNARVVAGMFRIIHQTLTVAQSRSVAKAHAACQALVLVGLSLSFATPAGGQCEPVWTQRVDLPQHRRDAVMVFDSWREVTLMIGGFIAPNDPGVRYLWQWDGVQWTRLDEIGPTERLDLAELAFDSDRGVTVLHTRVRNRPSQTWEFDGDSWTLVGAGPPLGGERTMTYDAARGVTLLWGENGIGTWSWDGASWTFLEPGPQPAFARVHMVYDSVREVVVMFGDFEGVSETWERAGHGWTKVAVGVPPRRFDHALGFDSGRGVTVLHGGNHSAGTFDDTWIWDGVSWTQVALGTPSARARHAMAYDSVRGEMLLFAGWNDNRALLNETWAWDGQTWRLRDEGEPLARVCSGMTYDSGRGRTIIFGGSAPFTRFNDTWEHDGVRWRLVSTDGPAGRNCHGMTFDRRLGLTVLFGGRDSTPFGDTWLWDGQDWSQLAVNGPSARTATPLAYDESRNVVVLFGGEEDGIGQFEDTWEFNGTQWLLRPTAGPPARARHGLAYDAVRDVVVLFGGIEVPQSGVFNFRPDTWLWDGESWTLAAQGGPPVRTHAAMSYDSTREKVVLFGGSDQNFRELGDAWEWDGAGWTQILARGPSSRLGTAMAHDSGRGVMMLHGGANNMNFYGETWELSAASPAIGDLNCDCSMDAFDIEPFIVALFDPDLYLALYPDCDILLADMNNDGAVNAFDIEPFINLLFGP